MPELDTIRLSRRIHCFMLAIHELLEARPGLHEDARVHPGYELNVELFERMRRLGVLWAHDVTILTTALGLWSAQPRVLQDLVRLLVDVLRRLQSEPEACAQVARLQAVLRRGGA